MVEWLTYFGGTLLAGASWALVTHHARAFSECIAADEEPPGDG